MRRVQLKDCRGLPSLKRCYQGGEKRTLIGLYLSCCCDVDEKSWFDPKSLMLPVLLPPPALEIASNSFCCCCKRFCLCWRNTAMAAIILNCTQDWKNEKKFLMNNKRSHFRFPGVVSEIQPKSSVMKKVFLGVLV